ncbi:MAG: EI24 domain-containing protein [Pseudomonadota bacterium]
MLSDFSRAISQLGDPRFRRVLFMGIGLTLLLLFGIYALFVGAISLFFPDSLTLPLIGTITWVDNLLSWATIPLIIGLSVFLMVPVASAFTGIFLDDVADAVEDRFYPHLTPAPRLSLAQGITDSLKFLGVILLANLVALFVYLIFIPFAPVIFWALNGFLLGREYFQLIAIRRLGPEGARKMRSRYMAQIWLAGGLMAIPLTVPLLNLLVPVLGAATFTHLFHRLNGTAKT